MSAIQLTCPNAIVAKPSRRAMPAGLKNMAEEGLSNEVKASPKAPARASVVTVRNLIPACARLSVGLLSAWLNPIVVMRRSQAQLTQREIISFFIDTPVDFVIV